MSDSFAAAPGRRTYTYVPRPRGVRGWLLDLLLVAITVALVLNFARRETVSCAWPEAGYGRCDLEKVNAVGSVQARTVEGIHGLGQRSGRTVQLVTDAKNKDVDAQFGTRKIEMWDEPAARALEHFAASHDQPAFVAVHGPSRPWLAGLALFGLLLTYVALTRRPAFAVTIDRPGASFIVAPYGWFGAERRYSLDEVRAVEVESPDGQRSRVRFELSSGERAALSERFFPGDHHLAFATEVARALAD